MSTTLFANGTIVSATGRQAGDVLVDASRHAQQPLAERAHPRLGRRRRK